jgi:hypothetical protein
MEWQTGHLSGSKFRERWYQQLWYIINTLVPVRYTSSKVKGENLKSLFRQGWKKWQGDNEEQ